MGDPGRPRRRFRVKREARRGSWGTKRPQSIGLRRAVQCGEMRVHDTVLRMRELLVERGVDLMPERADARSEYEGPGANAMQAWEAFRAVAVEPAFDPVQAWGDVHPVQSAGFLFEAGVSA